MGTFEEQLKELKELTAKLNEAYRKKGYVTSRAYLPKEAFVDGKLTVFFEVNR